MHIVYEPQTGALGLSISVSAPNFHSAGPTHLLAHSLTCAQLKCGVKITVIFAHINKISTLRALYLNITVNSVLQHCPIDWN